MKKTMKQKPKNCYLTSNPNAKPGDGSQSSPFNASNAGKFDDIMSRAPENGVVHLDDGEFFTNGRYHWQPAPGQKIRGRGIGLTKLTQWGINGSGTFNDKLLLPVGFFDYQERADGFEISDMTIDCGQSANLGASCGAVGVYGHHVKIERVRCINWGCNGKAEGFVLTTGGWHPRIEVEGIGGSHNLISDCYCDQPWDGTGAGGVMVLHNGGSTLPDGTFGKTAHTTIRNCTVDGSINGKRPPFVIRGAGLGSGWDLRFENNRMLNVSHAGPYQDTSGTDRIIVRGNYYENCLSCFYFNIADPRCISGSITIEDNEFNLPMHHPTHGATPCAINLYAPHVNSDVFKSVIIRGNQIYSASMGQDPSDESQAIKAMRFRNIVIRDNTIDVWGKPGDEHRIKLWGSGLDVPGRVNHRGNVTSFGDAVLPWDDTAKRFLV